MWGMFGGGGGGGGGGSETFYIISIHRPKK